MFAKAALLLLLSAQIAAAAMDPDEVRGLLEKMATDEVWGEAVFEDGRIRSFRVAVIEADSVKVVEVVGALQERPAVYALGKFRSLRELGAHRVQPRRAAFQPKKSGLVALMFEAPLPGAGYFYIGQKKQALALLGVTAAVVGTAFATGWDTAAGWVPMVVWIKISSLTNLRDQVRAINAAGLSVEMGALQGQPMPVPGIRVNLDF